MKYYFQYKIIKYIKYKYNTFRHVKFINNIVTKLKNIETFL